MKKLIMLVIGLVLGASALAQPTEHSRAVHQDVRHERQDARHDIRNERARMHMLHPQERMRMMRERERMNMMRHYRHHRNITIVR